jgi:hypothetical protein
MDLLCIVGYLIGIGFGLTIIAMSLIKLNQTTGYKRLYAVPITLGAIVVAGTIMFLKGCNN